jgi:hypothetical protein
MVAIFNVAFVGVVERNMSIRKNNKRKLEVDVGSLTTRNEACDFLEKALLAPTIGALANSSTSLKTREMYFLRDLLHLTSRKAVSIIDRVADARAVGTLLTTMSAAPTNILAFKSFYQKLEQQVVSMSSSVGTPVKFCQANAKIQLAAKSASKLQVSNKKTKREAKKAVIGANTYSGVTLKVRSGGLFERFQQLSLAAAAFGKDKTDSQLTAVEPSINIAREVLKICNKPLPVREDVVLRKFFSIKR